MNGTLKTALYEILLGSNPRTKDEVLKILNDAADPIIDEYLAGGSAEQKALVEWLNRPMFDSAHAAGLSKKLLTQLENISLSYAPTMGRLSLRTQKDLLRFKGMGPKLFQELLTWLISSAPKASDEMVATTINSVYFEKAGWSSSSIFCEYRIFAERQSTP